MGYGLLHTHRLHCYFHKRYALDLVLPDLEKLTKKALKHPMQANIIADAQLVCTYQKEQ